MPFPFLSPILSLSFYLSPIPSRSFSLSLSFSLRLLFSLLFSPSPFSLFLFSLFLFLLHFWTRNEGSRTGSRQRHHSTALGRTVTTTTILTTDQESTHPADWSALPAPRTSVFSPRPDVSGSMSSAPVSSAPVSGAIRLIRRLFIRRFCEIGFGF